MQLVRKKIVFTDANNKKTLRNIVLDTCKDLKTKKSLKVSEKQL